MMLGGVAVGLAFDAAHYARNERDLLGTAYRVAAGLLLGYLITHASAVFVPVSPS